MQTDQNKEITVLLVGPFPVNGHSTGGVSIWNRRVVNELLRRRKNVAVIPWYGRMPSGVTEKIELRPGLRWQFVYLLPALFLLKIRLIIHFLRQGYLSSISDIYRLVRVFAYVRAVLKQLDVSRRYIILASHVGFRSVFALFLRQELPDCRLAIDVHGSGVIEFALTHPALVRHLFRAADRILVRSLFIKQHCLQRGAEEEKIRLVPCGIEIQPESMIPEKRDLVIFCGALEERKDPMTLLRAIPAVHQHCGGKVQFHFIGEGPLRKTMENHIEENGLGDVAKLRGWLSNDEVNRNMRLARALVLPSIREPFGIVLIEALSAFTPCVVTNVGGMPEIVDSQVGFVVEPGDHRAVAGALIQLLQDRSQWEEKARKARQRAQRYDMQRIGELLQAALGL